MNKLIISILLMVGLVGIIGTAAADPSQTYVMGTVYDQNGDKLPGANVTVHNGTSCAYPQLGALQTTNSLGSYNIDVGALNAGDVVTVCAIHLTEGSGSNTKAIEACEGEGCEFNIACIPVQVPEFATIAIPIAAILGLMFIISSRKKKE